MQDGKGIMTRPDGTRYEGYWKNGEYHGHGVLTKPDGRRYEQYYEDGHLVEDW